MTGTLAAAAVSQLFLTVGGVLIARSLGPEDRGYFALLTLVPSICALIGLLGLPAALTYYIARDPLQTRRTVSTLVRPAMVQVAVIVLLQGAALLFLVADDPRRVQVAAVLSLLLGPGVLGVSYGLSILQGQHRFDAFNLLRVLPTACYVGAIVVIFLLGVADLLSVTAMWVGATLGGGALTLVVAARRLPKAPREEPVASLPEMTKFGLKSLLSAFSPVDALRLDQIAVALFLSPVALGYYVVAQAFTGFPRLVATSIGMIVYPRVASQHDATAARRAVWRYFALGVLVCGLITGGLAVTAGELVVFFFGSEFSETIPIARLLLLAIFFMTARRILTDGANGLGHPELGTVAEIASWVLLVPTLSLLVSPLGAEGVAISLAIAWGGSLAVLVALMLALTHRASAEVRSEGVP